MCDDVNVLNNLRIILLKAVFCVARLEYLLCDTSDVQTDHYIRK